MKKASLLFFLMVFVAGIFAQQARREIMFDLKLYDILGEAKVNDLKANNPQQLVIENCNYANYCVMAMKLTEPEGSYQMKGELKNYIKEGKTCNYQEIISLGYINRYDYNLEQDRYKKNVYPLGNTGGYVIVFSKEDFDENVEAWLREYGLK